MSRLGDRAPKTFEIPHITRMVSSVFISIFTISIGIFLPVISGSKSSDVLVNVPWGSLYGFGFFLTDFLPNVDPGLARFAIASFGIIIWPIGVVYSVYKVANNVLMRGNIKLLTITAFMLIISLMWNVEIGKVKTSFVYYLPLYSAFMDR